MDEYELELCRDYDAKIDWYVEELDIQPESLHDAIDEAFDKVFNTY